MYEYTETPSVADTVHPHLSALAGTRWADESLDDLEGLTDRQRADLAMDLPEPEPPTDAEMRAMYRDAVAQGYVKPTTYTPVPAHEPVTGKWTAGVYVDGDWKRVNPGRTYRTEAEAQRVSEMAAAKMRGGRKAS